jgi:hypothetical protein
MVLRTTASLGSSAMLGKPANVARGDSDIVVGASVAMEQLTDCIVSRRRHPIRVLGGCSRRFPGAGG